MELERIKQKIAVYLEDEKNGLSTYSLCAMTGLAYSTCHTYLSILEAQNIVKKSKTNGKAHWKLITTDLKAKLVKQ